MGTTIASSFDTRREAEMAVERLVQEHGLQRTDIFIEPESASNSAGTQADGADLEGGVKDTGNTGEPKLAGRIRVSVDLNDGGVTEKVRAAFREFGGKDVAQS